MRFLHLADLHLGKRLHAFSLREEQADMLRQVLEIAQEKKVDALLIAGDVYDRSVPSEEATGLLDSFLEACVRQHLQVFMISGNHDSSRRLNYGSALFDAHGIHICTAFTGELACVRTEDKDGPIDIWLFPFSKPFLVRDVLELDGGGLQKMFDEAMKTAHLDPAARNILLCHQFFTGGQSSDSEEDVVVGTLENISVANMPAFDYVACGHLHNPQCVGGQENIRYSGTLLKYSASEANVAKSIPLLDLGADSLEIELLPFTPLRDFQVLSGSWKTFADPAFYKDIDRENYIQLRLEESVLPPDTQNRLFQIYPRLTKISLKGEEVNQTIATASDEQLKLSPEEQIALFYEKMSDEPLSDYQKELVKELWGEVTCDR